MHYRQQHGIVVDVNHDRLVVSGQRQVAPPLRLEVSGEPFELRAGGVLDVPLPARQVSEARR